MKFSSANILDNPITFVFPILTNISFYKHPEKSVNEKRRKENLRETNVDSPSNSKQINRSTNQSEVDSNLDIEDKRSQWVTTMHYDIF